MRTFLSILNHEEADYRRRIELKYQIRKREILRLMNLRARSRQRTNAFAAANSPGGGDDAKPLAPHAGCDSMAPPLSYLPSGELPLRSGPSLITRSLAIRFHVFLTNYFFWPLINST